ncbi:hypothetical protein HDU93_000415 [Gonapodya sp. JEL0774]|nr:hypothetical protein HDU93_000415 [Gonapodya sp. JEL0774]
MPIGGHGGNVGGAGAGGSTGMVGHGGSVRPEEVVEAVFAELGMEWPKVRGAASKENGVSAGTVGSTDVANSSTSTATTRGSSANVVTKSLQSLVPTKDQEASVDENDPPGKFVWNGNPDGLPRWSRLDRNVWREDREHWAYVPPVDKEEDEDLPALLKSGSGLKRFGVVISAWVRNASGRYASRDRVAADLEAAMKAFPHMQPALETPLPQPDPHAGFEMIKLDGTIPVFWRTDSFNVPIVLYVPPTYPQAPPRIRIKPTASMQIRTGPAVPHESGEVVMPYLVQWSQQRELEGVSVVMIYRTAEEMGDIHSTHNTYQQKSNPDARISAFSHIMRILQCASIIFARLFAESETDYSTPTIQPPPAYPASPPRPPPAPAPMPPQSSPIVEALRLAKAAFEQQIPVYTKRSNPQSPPPGPAAYSRPNVSNYEPLSATGSAPGVLGRRPAPPPPMSDRSRELREVVAERVKRRALQVAKQADMMARQAWIAEEELKKVREKVKAMEDVEKRALANSQVIRSALPPLSRLLATVATLLVDPDDVVLVPTPLHAQAVDLVAEDWALEDTMVQAQSLVGKVDGGVGLVLKKLRELAKEQFELRGENI